MVFGLIFCSRQLISKLCLPNILKNYLATQTPLIRDTEPSNMILECFIPQSGYQGYLELYDEGQVEHINGPTHPPREQGYGLGGRR